MGSLLFADLVFTLLCAAIVLLLLENDNMQAVKVSWVNQTFALAKSNDSRGKKSRNRKSKEERKTMVETFIKR